MVEGIGMSNRPTIEHHLTPAETSYLMDLLHADWGRRVAETAVVSVIEGRLAYDHHVWTYLKRRPSILQNKLDENAYNQGFWEDGKGL